jgi:ABC-type multidrug transport system fused ATPase/permease subunit
MSGDILPFDRGRLLQKQNAAQRLPDLAARDRIRAELGASLAGLLGHDILAVDLLEEAARTGMTCGGLDLACLAEAACSLGADLESTATTPTRELWPAIIETEAGEWHLVLDQTDTSFVVIDVDAPDLRGEIAAVPGPLRLLAAPRRSVSARIARKFDAAMRHPLIAQARTHRADLTMLALGAVMSNALVLAAALAAFAWFDLGMVRWTPSVMAALFCGGALCVMLLMGLSAARFAATGHAETQLLSAIGDDGTADPRRLRARCDAFCLLPLGVALVSLAGVLAWIVLCGAIAAYMLSRLTPYHHGHRAEMAANLAFVALIATGLLYVFAGQNGVGWLMATGVLSWQILMTAAHLGGASLGDTLSTPARPKPGQRRERLDGRYLLTDVMLRSDEGANPVLDIKTLGLREGEVTALLGPNGAGKSALLSVLAGHAQPRQGRVLLDGLALGKIDPRDLRRGIGRLDMGAVASAMTLREALHLPHIARHEARQIAALNFAGLAHLLDHPRGLDRPLARPLPTGDGHALAFARIWLADPRIVLLDDPLQGLDQHRRLAMIAKLRQWLRGRMGVIASHDPALADLCDRMVVMEEGCVVMDGPRATVLAHMRRARSR